LNSLLGSLQERWGIEEVDQLGPCVIVPLKQFPKQDEEKLEKDGYKVAYRGYRGQTCAFIRLRSPGSLGSGGNGERQKTDPQPQDLTPNPLPEAEKVQPDQETEPMKTLLSKKHWTREDRGTLKKLYEQNVSVEDIAQRLKRTKTSVESQAQSLALRRHGINATATAGESESVPEKAVVPETPEHDGHLVREFLEATSVLYPRFRHAAALILKAAATEMQRGEA